MKSRIYSWMSPKIEVRTTSKYGTGNLPSIKSGKKTYIKKEGQGKGVFAKTPIKKGEVVLVMGGYILSIADENNLRGIVADKPIEIAADFSIGPLKASDLPKMPQHYINHSCDPNIGFDGQIFMVARRAIEKGEEIAYDYAMVMCPNEESDSFFSFECLCGTKKCRGVVKEDDWKNRELQKRYEGYFQHFLQKKINKLNKRIN